MSGGYGIRSDKLRSVVKAAKAQGFEHDKTGNHPALVCPMCGHREVYTASGVMKHHEMRAKISRLRKHGLWFEGVGGEHA